MSKTCRGSVLSQRFLEVENIVSEIIISSVVVEALERNKSSEALAKRLWMSFVVEGKDALYQEDVEEVLGHDRVAEAEE